MIRRPPRSTQSRSSAASDVYKRQPVTWSDDTVQTVACIAKSGHDVAALVELLVHCAGDDGDGDVEVGDGCLEPLDALRGAQQGDRRDVVGADLNVPVT